MNAHRHAELTQERTRLLDRVAEIDKEIALASNAARPLGRPTLPSVLVQVSVEMRKPLRIAEFVAILRQPRFPTAAEDFPNMVYLSLVKLVKMGLMKKDRETWTYSVVEHEAESQINPSSPT